MNNVFQKDKILTIKFRITETDLMQINYVDKKIIKNISLIMNYFICVTFLYNNLKTNSFNTALKASPSVIRHRFNFLKMKSKVLIGRRKR